MHYKVLCDECDEVMVEKHSNWIEDGETYEKTLKCPRCKRQIAVAISSYRGINSLTEKGRLYLINN